MATRQELLEAIIHDAREELNKIEMDQLKENAKDFRPAWYKFHNCYSCPSSEDDYWWLYVYAMKMNDDGTIQCRTFEIDKHEKITIELRSNSFPAYFSSSFISIEKEEFDEAWKTLLTKIVDLNLV